MHRPELCPFLVFVTPWVFFTATRCCRRPVLCCQTAFFEGWSEVFCRLACVLAGLTGPLTRETPVSPAPGPTLQHALQPEGWMGWLNFKKSKLLHLIPSCSRTASSISNTECRERSLPHQSYMYYFVYSYFPVRHVPLVVKTRCCLSRCEIVRMLIFIKWFC